MVHILKTEDHAHVRDTISQMLTSASQSTGYSWGPSQLTLQAVHEGRIVGGLAGATNFDWLYIETLAVEASYRNRGLGRELVELAERIAMERGCWGSWVDTFSFQAPAFYLKLGYEQFGELPHYPDSQSRLFFRKLFTRP